MTSRHILVSAYGCEPGKGSEQGVGWNWILQLAKLADVVVLTRSNNREAIEAALPADVGARIRFLYYDLPEVVRGLKRKERGLYLYYLLWQWGAYRCARRELAVRPVDYVMHLTFGSIWLPVFLHRLPVPFIWGPVGGGEAVPWALVGSLPIKGRLVQYMRYLLMATLAINPLFAGPARKSRMILARTEDTARVIPRRYRGKTRVVLETAAAQDWFDRPRAPREEGHATSMRVIYTGRLVPLKNLDMAIRAVAVARRRGADIRFDIIGDGPLQAALSRLATHEGIADAVNFVGRLSQDEVFERLSRSDLFLFPSLKEGGVWSLMEAMAMGLPSVCVRTSGMAVIADPTCARLIDPGAPADMVEAFATALGDLAAAPEERRRMGANARSRLEHEFRWEQKAAFMASLFEEMEKGGM